MYKRPLVISNGQIEELQAGNLLDQSAVIVGPIGPTGPSGPSGPAAIGPSGPSGPPGATGPAAQSFFRIFTDGFALESPATTFNAGVIGVFSTLNGSDSIEIISGVSERMDQLTSYVQTSNPGVGFQSLVNSMATLVGLPNLTTVDLSLNILPSSVVNQILSDMVANGATGGNLNLSGQLRPAAATGQGLLDKATLESRGWTVTLDASSNLTTDQVNSVLAAYLPLFSTIQTAYTLDLSGNVPSAGASGTGIIDLCRLRMTANGYEWTVNVDPWVGTSADLDTILASLVAADSGGSGGGGSSSRGLFTGAYVDFSQSGACTPSDSAIANVAILRNFSGLSVTTDPQAALTSSDVTTVLNSLVSSGTIGCQWPTYAPFTINLSSVPPASPAPPNAAAIADIAILATMGWAPTTDPWPNLTSSDLDSILDTLVASGLWGWCPTGSYYTLQVSGMSPPATPSVDAITDIGLLSGKGWTVVTDPFPSLASSDIDTILNAWVAANMNGNGTTFTLSGAAPSNQAIADAAALQARNFVISLDPMANLATSDVDAILAALVAIFTGWGSGPGSSWSGYLNVSGNSPAAPPTNTTDLATLVAWGLTIITD